MVSACSARTVLFVTFTGPWAPLHPLHAGTRSAQAHAYACMHAAAFGRVSLQAHGAGPAPAQFTFCASADDAVEDLCVVKKPRWGRGLDDAQDTGGIGRDQRPGVGQGREGGNGKAVNSNTRPVLRAAAMIVKHVIQNRTKTIYTMELETNCLRCQLPHAPCIEAPCARQLARRSRRRGRQGHRRRRRRRARDHAQRELVEHALL